MIIYVDKLGATRGQRISATSKKEALGRFVDKNQKLGRTPIQIIGVPEFDGWTTTLFNVTVEQPPPDFKFESVPRVKSTK